MPETIQVKERKIGVVFIALSAKPDEIAADIKIVETDKGAKYFLEQGEMSAPQLHVLKILSEQLLKEKENDGDLLFLNFGRSRDDSPDVDVTMLTSYRPLDVMALLEASELSSRIVEIFNEPFRPSDLPKDFRPALDAPRGSN